MGYKIKFFYCEASENSFNLAEKKEFIKKIGTKEDDVDVSQVAKLISIQLARRDILITDFEVYEYIEKKISAKQTKDGIIIKSKKFTLDQESNLTCQDLEETKPMPMQTQLQTPVHVPAPIQENSRPIRWMMFEPHPHEHEVANIKLTVGKKYPIFREGEMSLEGITLHIKDDLGRIIKIKDKYFIPATQKLFADEELGFSNNQKTKGTVDLWKGLKTMDRQDEEIYSNVPDIRKGKV